MTIWRSGSPQLGPRQLTSPFRSRCRSDVAPCVSSSVRWRTEPTTGCSLRSNCALGGPSGPGASAGRLGVLTLTRFKPAGESVTVLPFQRWRGCRTAWKRCRLLGIRPSGLRGRMGAQPRCPPRPSGSSSASAPPLARAVTCPSDGRHSRWLEPDAVARFRRRPGRPEARSLSGSVRHAAIRSHPE